MKTVIKGALLLGLLISQPLWALTLSEGREQGRVGETLSGYIAPIKQDKETLALVKGINDARTVHYQQLADSNNISVDEIARLGRAKTCVAGAARGIRSGDKRTVDA